MTDTFARRLRVARVWAGYSRQDAFGDALADAYPGWQVRRVAKRVELGERTLSTDETAIWARRVGEVTGVPEVFLLHGWASQPTATDIAQAIGDFRAFTRKHAPVLSALPAPPHLNNAAPDGVIRPRP